MEALAYDEKRHAICARYRGTARRVQTQREARAGSPRGPWGPPPCEPGDPRGGGPSPAQMPSTQTSKMLAASTGHGRARVVRTKRLGLIRSKSLFKFVSGLTSLFVRETNSKRKAGPGLSLPSWPSALHPPPKMKFKFQFKLTSGVSI